MTFDPRTLAGNRNPSRVELSRKRLFVARPDLKEADLLCCIPTWTFKDAKIEAISEHLKMGVSRAAVVISIHPKLVIAAYAGELDCVAMLQFPSEVLVEQYNLDIGSRLLTVNTYKSESRTDTDLIVGPLAIPRWSGFEPIIADFLTEDFNRIHERKNDIQEIEWERTFKMGKIYEEVCKKKFSSWSLWEEVIYRDGTPGKTSKPVIHFNVDLKDPDNSQIRQSDLKEAARVCGFTNDPYTSPIICPSVLIMK